MHVYTVGNLIAMKRVLLIDQLHAFGFFYFVLKSYISYTDEMVDDYFRVYETILYALTLGEVTIFGHF